MCYGHLGNLLDIQGIFGAFSGHLMGIFGAFWACYGGCHLTNWQFLKMWCNLSILLIWQNWQIDWFWKKRQLVNLAKNDRFSQNASIFGIILTKKWKFSEKNYEFLLFSGKNVQSFLTNWQILKIIVNLSILLKIDTCVQNL